MRVHTLSEKLRVDDQRAQWRRRGGGALTRRSSPLPRSSRLGRVHVGLCRRMPVGCACVSAASVSPETRDSDDEALEAYESDLARRDPPASPSISPRGPQHPLRVDPRHDYRGSEHGLRSRPSLARPGHRPVLVDRSREGRSRSRSSVSTPRACARGRDATRSPPNAPLDGTLTRTFDDDAWANLPPPPPARSRRSCARACRPIFAPRVWLATSGASAKRAAAPADYYASLVAAPADRAVADRSNLISTARSPRTRGWRRRKGRRRCDAS